MVDKNKFVNNTLDHVIALFRQDFHGNIFCETLLKCITCNELIKPIVSVLMPFHKDHKNTVPPF